MTKEIVIKSTDQFEKIIRERKDKARKRQVNKNCMNKEQLPASVNHADVANQVIKVISVLNIDPYIKRVMTMRILAPMLTGKSKSHLSIALELGMTEDEVKEIEQYGIGIVNDLLQKCSSADFVNKFNRDSKVEQEVKKLGKSLIV